MISMLASQNLNWDVSLPHPPLVSVCDISSVSFSTSWASSETWPRRASA